MRQKSSFSGMRSSSVWTLWCLLTCAQEALTFNCYTLRLRFPCVGETQSRGDVISPSLATAGAPNSRQQSCSSPSNPGSGLPRRLFRTLEPLKHSMWSLRIPAPYGNLMIGREKQKLHCRACSSSQPLSSSFALTSNEPRLTSINLRYNLQPRPNLTSFNNVDL